MADVLHGELARLGRLVSELERSDRQAHISGNGVLMGYYSRELDAARRALSAFVVANLDMLTQAAPPPVIEEPAFLDPLLTPALLDKRATAAVDKVSDY